jgi:hypothetical protein
MRKSKSKASSSYSSVGRSRNWFVEGLNGMQVGKQQPRPPSSCCTRGANGRCQFIAHGAGFSTWQTYFHTCFVLDQVIIRQPWLREWLKELKDRAPDWEDEQLTVGWVCWKGRV